MSEEKKKNTIRCDVCFHGCEIPEGLTGRCRARKNENGRNVCANYGRLTSIALDPIEKKPLVAFYPGSQILSVGSYGCNLACPFCQNAAISMTNERTVDYQEVSPRELADIARQLPDNLGVAFTYNEPSISYEYIIDTAKELQGSGKKIVVVSNGTINPAILEKLLPWVDAFNIDLKGDKEFYKELMGDYDSVKKTIATAAKDAHVEVTTLVIPGKNDNPEWAEEEAKWLAEIDPNIVLHLSRYFPRYHYETPATPPETLYRMKEAAQKHLKNVYLGNI